MIHFQAVGARHVLAPLLEQLQTTGSNESPNPSIILVGASSIEEATAAIDNLTLEQRHRAILVGVEGTLRMQVLPKPGSFAAMLEAAQLVGAIQRPLGDDALAFAGRKDLAEPMGLIYLREFQSPTYAEWHGLDHYVDVATFLGRMAAVLDEST